MTQELLLCVGGPLDGQCKPGYPSPHDDYKLDTWKMAGYRELVTIRLWVWQHWTPEMVFRTLMLSHARINGTKNIDMLLRECGEEA